VRKRRWTRGQQLRPARLAMTDSWLERASPAQFGAAGLLQGLMELRLRRRRLWRRNLRDGALVDSLAGPLGLREECEPETVSVDEAILAEQSTLREFRQFTIDPDSVRIVFDGRIYTISGSVTGPSGTHTRIRVWLGDPATGCKRRDPMLGTETLVSGNLIVDLPGGYNHFSLVIDVLQLPANIVDPPSSADPWVMTAGATGGEAESDPVLLPPPEDISNDPEGLESVNQEVPRPPIIMVPPPEGVVVRGATIYDIKGLQVASESKLLVQAWPAANRQKIADAPSFATVLEPGTTRFSILVRLLSEGPNPFVMSTTDLNTGFESVIAIVPSITLKEQSTERGAASSRAKNTVAVESNEAAKASRSRSQHGSRLIDDGSSSGRTGSS